MEEQVYPAMRTFEGGATRNTDKNKLDFEGFFSPLVLEEYAKYLHAHRLQADGNLRASDNWQNGIPTAVYFKSLLRHVIEAWKIHRQNGVLELINGKEVHTAIFRAVMITALCAICFNAFGYIFELLREEK